MFLFFAASFFILTLTTHSSLAQEKNKTNTLLCPPGEHQVKAHTQSAYPRSDGTLVSGSFHKTHCKKNPPSYVVWNERLKNGPPPTWEFKDEKSKTWTETEKENVLEALSILPFELLNTSINGIYRLKTFLKQPTNPAYYYDKQIAIYDDAFGKNRNLAQILAHEFTHHFFKGLPMAEKVDYAKAALWAPKQMNGQWIPIPTRQNFVEEDGKSGVDEDFTNNVEYFLFHPETLKSKTPAIFDWINKKYGDKFKLRKAQ